MASVTLYLSGSFDVGANNFTIYHSTQDPGNIIAQNVSAATLSAGYCTDRIYSSYVVVSNTELCNSSYFVTVSGVPTPTPTATGIPFTPTPSPSATGPTPTPTPSATGPTPTPTAEGPTSTPTSTPTPTPTPTGQVYELQISDGSTNSNQCAATFIDVVYTDRIMPLWSASAQRVYTDSTLSVGYNGGNEYYRISSGSSDRVWSVSATGLVSVQGPICENIYQFYTNQGFLTDGQECSATASVERYSPDFTTVADMQEGDYIYADSNLQFQLNDGYYYGASDTSGSTPTKAFQYSVLFGVTNLGECGAGTAVSMSSAGITSLDACTDTTPQFLAYTSGSDDPYNMQVGQRFYGNSQLTDGFGQNDLWYGVYSGSQSSPVKAYKLSGTDPNNGYVAQVVTCNVPTSTPTPSPSPTPLVFYPISASAGSTDQDQCGASLTQLLYTDRIINTWTSLNNAVWTDQNLTTRFDGGNNFFRFASGSDDEVWSISATGLVSTEGPDCANIQEFYSNAGFLVAGQECIATASVARYSPSFTGSVANMPTGAKIYSDATYSTELNDGYYYGFADTTGSVPDIAGQYNLINGIQSLGDCQAGVGFDLSSLGVSSTDACNDTTPQYTGYVTSSLDPYNLQLGDVIYENPQLTDTFGSNNVWYGVYSGSQSSPIKAYELNNGAVIQIFTCPTPTSTPTPTPSPTPFINYPISASNPDTSPDLCGQPFVNQYYMSQPIQQFAVIYTDPTHTTRLTGANRYYRLTTGSQDEVWSVSNSGVISTQGPNCTGSLFQFYSTTAQPQTGTACDELLPNEVYTLAFTTVDDILPGDRIYTTASLETELSDSSRYGVSDTNTGVTLEFDYYLVSGVSNIVLCPTPTPTATATPTPTPSPTPTSTPTPTPTATPTVYGLNKTTPQTIQGIVCGANATDGKIYTTRSRGLNLQNGDVVYADGNLTTPFNGGNDYYGIATETGTTPEVEVRIDAGGNVSQRATCPPPPTASPTPSPTPVPVQNYRSSNGYNNTTDACNDTSLNVIWAEKDVSQLQANDYIYTNSSLTTPFNGGGQYWGLESGTSSYRAAALIDTNGRIQLISSCP